MANSSLNLTSLDFDALKQSLISFMQSQTVFKDYNFSGSNMSVLMDLLSYNTYLNSFYLNMVASEAFLDTAQLRDSVVSIAKELNYVPRSARSSKANIKVVFKTFGINGSFLIPAGTMFSGKNSNGSFMFVTDQTHTLLSAGSEYAIQSMNVYEGKTITETFVVDNTIENQKFILSNLNIDTTSIQMTVQGSGKTTTFTQVQNLFGLTSTSNIFFVQEDRGSYYEIYFGDGVFGFVPVNGSIITVSYRVTKGSGGNGITGFTLAQDLGIPNDGVILSSNVSMVSYSQDGSALEDISTIKFRAPKHFQTQNRAVTASDYKDLIIENYPEVKDVSVYGGEDVSGSVQYGTVFIALTTISGTVLSASLKTDVANFLSTKKTLTTKLSIVDADYIYIVPNITAYIDFTNTAKTASDIYSEIVNSVKTYNDTTLKSFNSTFMLSKFSAAVDSSDSAICGSQTTLTMYKNILFANGFPQAVTLNFNNSITPGTIISTEFVLSDGNKYNIVDFNPAINTFQGQVSNGVFGVKNSTNYIYFNQISTNNVQNYTRAGVVDYDKGSLLIQSIDVYNFMNPSGIRISATPLNDEIYGILENVVEIDTANLIINTVSS